MFEIYTKFLCSCSTALFVGLVGIACEDRVGSDLPNGAYAIDTTIWGYTGEATNAASLTDPIPVNPEKIGDRLRADLPNWDTELFLGKGLSALGFSAIDPVSTYETAKSISSSSFYFTEVRPNGRTVFKNANGETIKFNEAQGYWKFISNENINSQRADKPLTNEQALSLSEELFVKLDIDKEQKGEEFSVGIGTATEDELASHAAQPIGRYVRIHRQLNGVLVFDSYLATNYELDGNLSSLEIRWPEVNVAENCTVIVRDDFVSLMLSKHPNVFANIVEERKIASRLLYVYDETTGKHVPALQMSFQSGINELTKQPNQIDLFVSLCKEDEANILF